MKKQNKKQPIYSLKLKKLKIEYQKKLAFKKIKKL